MTLERRQIERRFYVEYQPRNGRPKNYTDFSSALARDLFIISLAETADILRQWETEGTETTHLGDQIDKMVAELPATRERTALERAQREAREAARQ